MSYGFRLIDSTLKGVSRGFAEQIGWSAMSRRADGDGQVAFGRPRRAARQNPETHRLSFVAKADQSELIGRKPYHPQKAQHANAENLKFPSFQQTAGAE